MRERTKTTLECIVISAIILVLIQIFLEDFAVIAGWNWNLRLILVFTGLFFDLLFTIEFIVRFYTAVYNGNGFDYIARKRGWIDFAASIPLLLFGSGPAVLGVLTGRTITVVLGNMLTVLKVAKAVRVARILRVLKVFKQIENTESAMAERHATKIITIAVTVVVFAVLTSGIVFDQLEIPSVSDHAAREHDLTAEAIIASSTEAKLTALDIEKIAAWSDHLLILKEDGVTTYTRFSNEFYREMYGPEDYLFLERGRYTLFFDRKPILVLQARDNLIFFVIIILLVVVLLVYYFPHFALTVTDPIHLMRKGVADTACNTLVKIPKQYRNDDIYRLAGLYNSVLVSLEDTGRDQHEAENSVLDSNDIKSAFDDDA